MRDSRDGRRLSDGEREKNPRSSATPPCDVGPNGDADTAFPGDESVIAALRAIVVEYDRKARLASVDATHEDNLGPAVSEKGIGADGGASTGEAPMCKIYLCKDRGNTWRVRLVDKEMKRKKNYLFATESEARAAMPKIQKDYRRPIGLVMSEAFAEYRKHLETRGNRPGRPNLPRTVEVTLQRLRKVFNLEIVTGELTPVIVQKLWDGFKTDKAVDTLLNTLAQAKTFFRWMTGRGWLKHPAALDGIEVVGRRKKGKPQLTEDESKRLLECAVRLGKEGDAGAVATATALLLGLRASEIIQRICRDLDAGGTKLRITSSKTAAGIRTMKVPAVLQELLRPLAAGKQPNERLFGKRNRYWALRSVQRLCTAAKVPCVSAHGLRGTHARLAVEAGIRGEVVAASLGHENFAVTTEHYAGADAVAGAAVDRVADILE